MIISLVFQLWHKAQLFGGVWRCLEMRFRLKVYFLRFRRQFKEEGGLGCNDKPQKSSLLVYCCHCLLACILVVSFLLLPILFFVAFLFDCLFPCNYVHYANVLILYLWFRI